MSASVATEAVVALRAELWDAGYRPLAVYGHDVQRVASKDRGKRPKGDDWQLRARLDPPEAAEATAELDALNTGILCDGLRALDLDVDDADLVARLRALAFETLGEAPMRSRDNSPRCLLLYGATEGEPTKRVLAGKLGKVEVLGRGQQFVGFGFHPSGAVLRWHPMAPTAFTREALPAITEAQVTAFLAAAAQIIGADEKASRAAGGDTMFPHTASAHGQTADPLDVVAALGAISNDGSADWDWWNKIGMATWAATGGTMSGFAAFAAWSERHPAHDPALCRERWEHYPNSPPDSIGAGTLFHLARKARPGWTKPTDAAAGTEAPSDGTSRHAQPRESAGRRIRWVEPIDFLADNGMAAPSLRAHHVPEALWPFITDTATRMGVDPACVALAALVSCASVISEEWAVQPKRNDYTWTEQARLWGAIVGDPSILKTPVISACTKPIDKMEASARREHAEEMRQWRLDCEVAKLDKQPPPRQPKLDRYMVEGATPEALSEVLRDDDDAKMRTPQGKVLSRHDEMSEFFGSLDRYKAGGKGGSERGAYLRLYNGGRYTVDRIGRGSFAVPNWSACFLGGCQPGPIQRIAKDAADDGLLQRFLYAVPAGQQAGLDQRPDADAVARYNALFPALAAMRPASAIGSDHPHPIVLSEVAQEHRAKVEALAIGMSKMPDISARLVASFGKWPGMFARLCLTFHLIEIADARLREATPAPMQVISGDIAVKVAEYMRGIALPHMLRADAVMFSTDQTGHAKWVAGFILAHKLERIGARDLVRSYRAFKAPEAAREMAAVMHTLVSIGWLEPEEPTNPSKPVVAWVVNPAVHERFAERARQEADRRTERKAQIFETAEWLKSQRG